MKWTLPVDLPPPPASMQCGEAVMLLGSCFAERIGQWFVSSKCPAVVNPWGVMYNPASIATAIQLSLLEEREATAQLKQSLFADKEGLWRSWLHDTSLLCTDAADALEQLLDVYKQSRQGILQTQWLFITWGTNRAYFHANKVVANCHRQPHSVFEERALSVDEIVAAWSELLHTLHQQCPEQHVVFTVSPYRYAKYGLHHNALSKSTLLLAIDALQQQFPHVSYFPAYEIVIDELRDYRFYAEDLCHPTTQASDYVWQRLVDWCATPPLQQQMSDAQQLQRALSHRVQHTQHTAYHHFLKQLHERMQAFAQRYPFADLNTEHADIQQRLATLDSAQ